MSSECRKQGNEGGRGSRATRTVALAVSLLAAPACADHEPDRFARVVAHVEAHFEERGLPGGAIAIVEDGELVASAGVGVRSVGTNEPVTDDMVFPVASMSKMITAATIMALVEEGLIDLDAPITDYVPEFVLADGDPAEITLHHLLTHSSGLVEWNDITFPKTEHCGLAPESLAAYWESSPTFPVLFPPGEAWMYGSPNYALAAFAAERAAGERFTTLAQNRVLTPAGMASATFDPAEAAAMPNTSIHEPLVDGSLAAVPIDTIPTCITALGGSGLFATLHDYAELAKVLMSNGGEVLSESSVDAMTTPHVETRRFTGDTYGYGLRVRTYKGLTLVEHGGGYDDFASSMFVMVPERQFAVVLFSNAGDSALESLSRVVLDVYLDLSGIEEPDGKTDPGEWEPYLGTYMDDSLFGAMEVVREGDGLVARLSIGIELEVEQVREDLWRTTFSDTVIDMTFWRDPPNGPVTQILTPGVTFRRVE